MNAHCTQDEPCTNAGLGSNLSWSGVVQCDASAMDGTDGAFGAIGAASGKRSVVEAVEY